MSQPRKMSSLGWCPRIGLETTHIYLTCWLDGRPSPDSLEVSWDEVGVIGAAELQPQAPIVTLPVWLEHPGKLGAETDNSVFLATNNPELMNALGLRPEQQKRITSLLKDGYYIRLQWVGTKGWEVNHNQVYRLQPTA